MKEGRPLRVAVIGIQGVPAAYGGFETLVENLIGENCPADVEYTVFCSSAECGERPASYKGARLRYVGLRSHGVQSILYDIVSMVKASRGYDVLLVLGTSGCSFLPLLRLWYRRRLVVNIDGLEHRRAKWGRLARRLLLFSEQMAVRCADCVIADNRGIADYVRSVYGRDPALIAYGGDHAVRDVSDEFAGSVLARYGVGAGNYCLAICRIEPENNCHLVLEAFRDAGRKLLFVGNWASSDYGRSLRERYAACPDIVMADAVYDLDTLHALRSRARCYIHGHSAGGTNPSLVEAMFAGRPVVAYDVVYNRATTAGRAAYFSDVAGLRRLISSELPDGSVLLEIAEKEYTWSRIAARYVSVLRT